MGGNMSQWAILRFKCIALCFSAYFIFIEAALSAQENEESLTFQAA